MTTTPHNMHPPPFYSVVNVIYVYFSFYNARSLLPKFDDFLASIDVHRPHIICVVESWISEGIDDNEISIPMEFSNFP